MGSETWCQVRLGDLISIKHGWPFASEYFSEVARERPIVVNIGNFRYTGGFRFEETTIKHYTGGFPQEYVLTPRDILLIMTCQTPNGEILGIPGRIPDDGYLYLHNQRLGKVIVNDPDHVDADYLYWLFLSPSFNRHLATTASGTKILHTSPGRIEAFEFLLPSLPEQRAIARILGALDDKIELNRRMNATLEGIARALFQSWFVDFDPVRAKAEGRSPAGMDARTAALFPDALVDSPLGPIPEGWEIRSYGQTISLTGGGTPKTSVSEYWGGDIPWFSVVDAPSDSDVFVVDTEKKITQAGLDNSSARLLPVGTTIISARGTVGKCALVGVPMAMNQSCYGVAGSGGQGTYFTYFSLRNMVAELQQSSHGSVFDTITRDTFERVRIVRPPSELTRRFDDCVQDFMADILNNLHESRTLAALRDTLLPRLLSGELRVGEAEEAISDAEMKGGQDPLRSSRPPAGAAPRWGRHRCSFHTW